MTFVLITLSFFFTAVNAAFLLISVQLKFGITVRAIVSKVLSSITLIMIAINSANLKDSVTVASFPVLSCIIILPVLLVTSIPSIICLTTVIM